MRLIFAILLTSTLLTCRGAFAQTAETPAAGTIDQQILDIFNGMSRHAARIEPMLRQLKPADWVAKGAPDAYVNQWNSALIEVQGIQSDMSSPDPASGPI